MLAPGCEVALSRLFSAVRWNRGDADVFASLDGIKLELPEWIRPLHPPSGGSGIVRPTRWCVHELEGSYEWLLRLTWDAELKEEALCFPRDPWSVYGSLRCNPIPLLRDALAEMGVINGRPERPYVDGFAILASVRWWVDAYCALPGSVTHYLDDSVSCQWSEYNGWRLEHRPIAIHRHHKWRKPDDTGP